MTAPYQPDSDHIAYLRDNVAQHWEAGAQLTPEDVKNSLPRSTGSSTPSPQPSSARAKPVPSTGPR